MGARESQGAILKRSQEENWEREQKCRAELMRTAYFWVGRQHGGLLVALWAAHCTGVRAWRRTFV